jgi:hypothetical protein
MLSSSNSCRHYNPSSPLVPPPGHLPLLLMLLLLVVLLQVFAMATAHGLSSLHWVPDPASSGCSVRNRHWQQ